MQNFGDCLMDLHAMRLYSRRPSLRPIKTSERNFQQIVIEKELELFSHIINYQEHHSQCKCMECWHKLADQILERQNNL